MFTLSVDIHCLMVGLVDQHCHRILTVMRQSITVIIHCLQQVLTMSDLILKTIILFFPSSLHWTVEIVIEGVLSILVFHEMSSLLLFCIISTVASTSHNLLHHYFTHVNH